MIPAGTRCVLCGEFYENGVHPIGVRIYLGQPYPCENSGKRECRERKPDELPTDEACFRSESRDNWEAMNELSKVLMKQIQQSIDQGNTREASRKRYELRELNAQMGNVPEIKEFLDSTSLVRFRKV